MYKSYFLVKKDYPIGMAINSAAHGGTMMLLKWDKNEPEMQEWFVVTENSLNDAEVILVFKPRKEYPKFFKFLKLFGK